MKKAIRQDARPKHERVFWAMRFTPEEIAWIALFAWVPFLITGLVGGGHSLFVLISIIVFCLTSGWPERVIVHEDHLEMWDGLLSREVLFVDIERMVVKKKRIFSYLDIRLRSDRTMRVYPFPGSSQRGPACVEAVFVQHCSRLAHPMRDPAE